MKVIPLYAKNIEINTKNNYIKYGTDVGAEKGIIVAGDTEGLHDMVIVNQLHEGGTVHVICKPTRTPARKFEIGAKIGYLVEL